MERLLARIAGLARWQGLDLVDDFARLRTAAGDLRADFRAMRAVRWDRYSGPQGRRQIPMLDLVGPLHLDGDGLAELWPLLALGATCHLGNHAALGLGRYTLDAG